MALRYNETTGKWEVTPDEPGDDGPRTQTVGGVLYQYDPGNDSWNPVAGGGEGGGGGGGLTFDEQMRLKQTPSSSFSSSTSQSFQDPRALALQEQGLAQSADQFNQSLGLQERELTQAWDQFLKGFGLQTQQLNHQIANDTAQLNFLKQKSAWEQKQGEQAGARDTIRLMDQIQGRVNQEQFQLAQITQQAQTTNAQFAMRASELNEAARVANLQQRQSVARDISEFTRSPGDVGAAAGFLRAGGGSDISTAIAEGKTAITPQSLAILNNMLAVSDEVMKDPRQIQAPQIGMPDYKPSEGLDVNALMSQFMAGQGGTKPPAAAGPLDAAGPRTWDVGTASPLGAASSGTPENIAAGYAGMQANAANGVATAFDAEGRNWEMVGDQWVEKLENGGWLDDMAIVGDSSDGKENREVVIGDAIVIPEDQLKGKGKKKIKKLENGGTIQNPLMRAQGFLDDAGKLAMQMGGFTNVPTPVGMARPGQSPYLANLGAAVASTTRGIPQELFLEELQRVTPRGVSENTLRRTR